MSSWDSSSSLQWALIARVVMRALQVIFLSERKRPLPFARLSDARTNGVGMFLRALARNVPIFDRWHFDVEIDAIEEGTGNTLAITLHLHGTAPTLTFQIAKVSAGAWMHC